MNYCMLGCRTNQVSSDRVFVCRRDLWGVKRVGSVVCLFAFES